MSNPGTHPPLAAQRSSLRAAIARAVKDNTGKADELRKDYKTVKAEEYIASILVGAPQLDVTRLQRILAPAVARVRELGGDV